MNFTSMQTEMRNVRTMNIDELSVEQALRLMNEEDATVATSVLKQIRPITEATEAVVKAFNQGGRLIYIGAGTSGRLGLLDAVECVPTFSVPPEMVQGIIAGGDRAFIRAVEGAEDDESQGETALADVKLVDKDIVIGLAASGRTPYVKGALKYARKLGAKTVAISCNENAEISEFSDIKIEVNTGPEVITGSTRLKAGTAQKLICNMISTVSMIQIGKVYSNLMVDLQPTNYKLVERAKHIIMQATECDYETASELFEASQHQPKVAIVMHLLNCDYETATLALQQNHHTIKQAIRRS